MDSTHRRAARNNGITYSQLIHGLKVGGIELDRKILADMAVNDAEGFTALVASAKQHVAKAQWMPSLTRSQNTFDIATKVKPVAAHAPKNYCRANAC